MVKEHSPDRARKAVRRLEAEGRPVLFRHNWRYLCGTLYEMPIEETPAELISAASAAVRHAQSVRKHHARRSKKDSKQRKVDIRLALERLAETMKPIRRLTAKAAYGPLAEADELREASAAIQRERRKLWKMNKTQTRRN